MEVTMRGRLKFAGLCIGLLLFGLVCGFQIRGQGQAGAAPQAGAPPAPADTAAMRAHYERWRTEFKTWGKRGTDDNKGTSNLITSDKIRKTMKLVNEGIVVSFTN